MDYILKQDQLNKIYKLIKEEINLDDYSNEDFFDVFLETFKKFLKETYGDSLPRAPLSYFIKKYGIEFLKKYDLLSGFLRNDDDEQEDVDLDLGYYELVDIGRSLVKNGLYDMPGLYKENKFLDKYGKQFDFFVKRLELPDYLNLKFTEETPYDLKGVISIDFEKMMKSNPNQIFNSNEFRTWRLEDQLKKELSNFLGIDFGKRAHGDLELDISDGGYENVDDWIKNVYKKTILKSISKIGGIKSVRLSKPKGLYEKPNLRVRYNYSKSTNQEIKQSIGEIFRTAGVNPNMISYDISYEH